MELNKEGFVIKGSGGVEVFSYHSALSGIPLSNGAITTPVPGMPGLFYRLDAGEGRLTPEQRADVEQRAKAWYAGRQVLPALRSPVMNRRASSVAPVEEEKESED